MLNRIYHFFKLKKNFSGMFPIVNNFVNKFEVCD
jgi:hypothetical protein